MADDLLTGDLVRIKRGAWEGLCARVIEKTETSVKVVFDDDRQDEARWYARAEVLPYHRALRTGAA